MRAPCPSRVQSGRCSEARQKRRIGACRMLHAGCRVVHAHLYDACRRLHAVRCKIAAPRAMSRVACLQSCRMLSAHVVWLSMARVTCAAHERDEARLAEQQRESARRCGLCREHVVRSAAQKPPMPYKPAPALERAPWRMRLARLNIKSKGRLFAFEPSKHRPPVTLGPTST